MRRRDPGPLPWTDAPPTANPTIALAKEQLVNTRLGWSQTAGGWDAPGWTPLVDHGPLPLQTARSVGRWLWPTLSVSGFLVVTGFVLGHDDPTPGLSLRGLLTIALAAAVVVLLTVRRTTGTGPLTRALFEYTVVFLLAVLIATTGVDVDQAPTARQAALPRISGRRWSRPSTGSATGSASGGTGPTRRPTAAPSPRPPFRSDEPGDGSLSPVSPSTRRPL